MHWHIYIYIHKHMYIYIYIYVYTAKNSLREPLAQGVGADVDHDVDVRHLRGEATVD